MSFKEYLNEGEHTLSAAMRRRDKKYDTAVKKAKAYMKNFKVSAEEAAAEYEVKVEDLNEAYKAKSYLEVLKELKSMKDGGKLPPRYETIIGGIIDFIAEDQNYKQ